MFKERNVSGMSIWFTAFSLLVSGSAVASSVLDVNVGYSAGNGPTPISDICLDPQVVFGTKKAPVTTTIFYGAAVEPTLAVNPSNPNKIVACWQQDRISNGGSLEAGIAYSSNGGVTWNRTTVPTQVCTGGVTQRVSDVWLSYSSDGATLYLCILPFNATVDPSVGNQQGVAVSISKDDGATWSAPQFIASSVEAIDEPSLQFPIDDKNSVTGDPNHSTYAYAVWDRFEQATSYHSTTRISVTKNSGATWSRQHLLYDPFPDLTSQQLSNGNINNCQTIDNVILVLPQSKGGTLFNFMVRQYAAPSASNNQFINDAFPFKYTLYDIAFVRSSDFGQTWETTATQVTPFKSSQVYTNGYKYKGNGSIKEGNGQLLRTGDIIPSFAVNPINGNLYVAFQTGQFRSDELPQIGLMTSRDGGRTWSNAVRINVTPQSAFNPQAFTPFVAVTADGHVGIMYSDFRNNSSLNTTATNTDTWLAIYKEVANPNGGSTGIGLDLQSETRLSQSSYIAENGPTTTQGIMTNGDYGFLVAQNNQFYAIYTKSFNGPFTPSEKIFKENYGIVKLDNNLRQAPFFSIVAP